MRIAHTAQELFSARVQISEGTGCWNWTGSLDKNGYGLLSVARDKKLFRAHRWAYLQAKGEIPKGFVLDHLCRNRRCVNPDHLEVVTNKENLLRGVGANMVTHKTGVCKRGHEIAGDNALHVTDYRTGKQQTCCNTCHKASMRASYLKRKGQKNDSTPS